ncbi:hypothetical protein W822_22265 [Advenella kashmirensis W13003]|uniref:Uncharacterized protein n=1 Tax=Advenella kashmirensis W13003 TaxID=1424334 RepID=V8QMP1_9BURK|nr:hypothetical protein W822_22265 [Advenella kashmirensis W13003]
MPTLPDDFALSENPRGRAPKTGNLPSRNDHRRYDIEIATKTAARHNNIVES